MSSNAITQWDRTPGGDVSPITVLPAYLVKTGGRYSLGVDLSAKNAEFGADTTIGRGLPVDTVSDTQTVGLVNGRFVLLKFVS